MAERVAHARCEARRHVELGAVAGRGLPGWGGVGGVVVRVALHGVVFVLDEEGDGLDGEVQGGRGGAVLAGEVRGTDEGLADVGDGLVGEDVLPREVLALAALEGQALRVPAAPVKGHGADVLFEPELERVVEEVAVADEEHALDVVLELGLVGDEGEDGDGGGHLEEAVAEEFQALVVAAHAALEVDLLGAVLVAVVAVLGKGFQREIRPDVEAEHLAGFQSDEVRVDAVHDCREGVEHGDHVHRQLCRC